MMRPAAQDVFNPQEGLTPITPNMERGEIYGAIVERTPYIAKRACTLRVMEESGVNALLDQLCVIQRIEYETEINYLQGEYNEQPRRF